MGMPRREEKEKSVLFFSVTYLTRVHFVEVNKYYMAPRCSVYSRV